LLEKSLFCGFESRRTLSEKRVEDIRTALPD
jgi:hypothetical protein